MGSIKTMYICEEDSDATNVNSQEAAVGTGTTEKDIL